MGIGKWCSKLVIAVDFDDTIHNSKWPLPGRRMGGPVEGAEVAIRKLKDEGHHIIIFTVWGPERHHVIADWLDYYHIPFDYITNVKPACDWYIDDRAIHFDNWFNVMEKIHAEKTN